MSYEVAVSVLVPYHNAAEHIGRCLDSLLAQTLSDIQIVAVDDGSEDDSRTIVESYAERHPGRIVSVAQPHGGRSEARNFALACARGEFIGFVDADDWADSGMYERLLASARSAEADLAVCDYAWMTEADPRPRLIHEGDASEYGRSLAENPRILRFCHGSLCNKLFARHLFGERREFFPVGIDFEDLATVYLLMARANRIEKVDGDPLYFYVQGSPTSIMSARDERYLQMIDALKIMDAGFKADGVFERFSAELLRVNLLHLIFSRYSDFFLSVPRSLSWRFIDSAFLHLDRDFPGWRRTDIADSFESNSVYVFVSTHRPLLKAYIAFLGKRK